ncbi:MAG: type II CRISPR-associated endonuclease Cas1 [Porphyromonadaceae bacterium]|nr:type II CRISPR-associated endonuclease Cas1 [Porphyromonadaceae bacterium]
MIKKTLYFGNPAYLSFNNGQLVLRLPEVEKNDSLPISFKQKAIRTIPVEDIGVLLLDHQQITVTHALLSALLDNNCAIITCDNNHLPTGLMLPLCGNATQSERFHDQIEASLPLQKQLWRQTVQAKIANQAKLLHERKIECGNMLKWITEVHSGDTDNIEARAAVYYWSNLFPQIPYFSRKRDGVPPNNLLNYGYAILRAIVARALVGSGLLPTLGIHHHNRYNAYCLADDIMEPYRPYVDRLVCEFLDERIDITQLQTNIKTRLLTLPTTEVIIDGQRSPLMIAVAQTTATVYKCFSGETRKITYPEM